MKLPDHLVNSLELYKSDGIMPGSFLTACLENNLVQAFARADQVNQYLLHDIARYLYNEMPFNSWGDRKTVSEWSRTKGVRGTADRVRERAIRFNDKRLTD